MGILLGGIVFALVTAWMLVSRIRARSQNYSQGGDRVAKQLGENTTSDNTQTWVEVWDACPLTKPMIKELASSMGYAFVEDGLSRRNAAKVLVFTPPKPKQRRLDL
jgi:hypothetical protein